MVNRFEAINKEYSDLKDVYGELVETTTTLNDELRAQDMVTMWYVQNHRVELRRPSRLRSSMLIANSTRIGPFKAVPFRHSSSRAWRSRTSRSGTSTVERSMLRTCL